jgi:hypothetical protein
MRVVSRFNMIRSGDVNFIVQENSFCIDMKFKDLVDEGGTMLPPPNRSCALCDDYVSLSGSYRISGEPPAGCGTPVEGYPAILLFSRASFIY